MTICNRDTGKDTMLLRPTDGTTLSCYLCQCNFAITPIMLSGHSKCSSNCLTGIGIQACIHIHKCSNCHVKSSSAPEHSALAMQR